MRDAAALPWTTVRAAWATFMHEVEEGRLSWSDSTQWALNRLSSSQVALASSSQQPAQQRKVCRYFNENKCSHEADRGQYRHICSFCFCSNKFNAHPEAKCMFKSRQGSKQADPRPAMA